MKSASRGGGGGWWCLVQGGLPGPGGVCSRGGAWSRGVSACSGGVCLFRGGSTWSGGVCLVRGGISQHALRQTPLPPPVDRQTPVKILPWPNFVAAGKYIEIHAFITTFFFAEVILASLFNKGLWKPVPWSLAII